MSRRIAVSALAALVVLSVAAVAWAKPGVPGSTGAGWVFWINPVQDLENQGLDGSSLRDERDSASAVPEAAYHEVELTGLDGSGYLRGDYVRVKAETGNPAYSPTREYRYTRDQDEFEQVMVYYWITEAQEYLQSLGFTGDRAILDEGIDVRINQWGQDNSYFWDKHHVLRFGKGGVDDAEDAEVILHEYGHAIHGAQVPGFGTTPDAGAIGEAFGDYFAVSFGNAVTGNTFEKPCVMDWDATSYDPTEPYCLRRTDGDLHYPEDLRNPRQVHADGRIWSRALWDINQAVGNVRADKIIIGAQFDFAPDTSFVAAAKTTVAYAKATDAPAAPAVCDAFVDRGFITAADCNL